MLDIVIDVEGQVLPRRVYDGVSWKNATTLLPPDEGALREYAWEVGRYSGKTLRITLVDEDARIGCYLISTGFEFLTPDDVNARSFATAMRRLEKGRKLPPMLRYDSKHFMALSNAGAAQTEYRLYNCETLYSTFLKHFRKAGFTVTVPDETLMVAVFSNQDGFESYLGGSLGQGVTGLYHPTTNRLVVYDYGTNRAFVDSIKQMESQATKGSSDLERQRKVITFGKWVKDRRDDVNLSTMMHEAAHQMSFNTGLMNRDGDVAVWLAEGLATYCEPTARGEWLGPGAINAQRIVALQRPAKGHGEFIPLRELVKSDDWIRKAKSNEEVLLGYAQSWALFRMLMEERPRAMKSYLKAIYERRTTDHRLTDFGASFGSDLGKLERRYREYMKGLAKES